MSFGNMRRSAQQNNDDLNQMVRGCAALFVAISVGILLYALWSVL